MDVNQYIDSVIFGNYVLKYDERIDIVDNIYKVTQGLPLKKPFTRDQLMAFDDRTLVIYLSDVYELITIKYFMTVGRNPSNITTV